MLSIDEYKNINSKMFSAALDPTQWHEVMKALSSASGGVNTQIMGYDRKRGISIDIVSGGYDPAYFDSFMEYYSSINPWADHFASFAVGEVVPLSAYCDERELRKTEFYHDWVVPQEELIGGGGALLQRADHCLFLIGGNIRRRDQEHLEPRWLDVLRQLLPTLQQAWSVTQALAGGAVERCATGIAATGYPSIFIVGEDCRLLYSNETGQQAIAASEVVYVDIGGRLTFVDPDVNDRVKRKAGPFDRMEIGNGTQPAFRLHMVDFDPDSLGDWHLGLTLGITTKCTMLIMDDLRLETDRVSDYFQSKGLTPAELDVANAIAAGQRIEDIADVRQVTRQTVRNQLKAIFSKCSISRQSELIRLVASIKS